MMEIVIGLVDTHAGGRGCDVTDDSEESGIAVSGCGFVGEGCVSDVWAGSDSDHVIGCGPVFSLLEIEIEIDVGLDCANVLELDSAFVQGSAIVLEISKGFGRAQLSEMYCAPARDLSPVQDFYHTIQLNEDQSDWAIRECNTYIGEGLSTGRFFSVSASSSRPCKNPSK